MTKQDFLLDPASFASSLLLITIDEFGAEVFEWESESLYHELEKFAGSQIPPTNIHKLESLMLTLVNDLFYTDILAFNDVCNSIGGENNPVLFNVFEPPDPGEIAWAVYEIALNDPLLKDESLPDRFSGDLKTYIGYLLRGNGVFIPPRPIDFIEIPGKDSAESIFIDDPALYEAYTQMQLEIKGRIEAYVSERMKSLIAQLKDLKLKNGDTSKFVALVEGPGGENNGKAGEV